MAVETEQDIPETQPLTATTQQQLCNNYILLLITINKKIIL
jgi:hypothetical protein